MSTLMSVPPLGDRVVGQPFARTEAAQKVSGALAYTGDIHIENMLYGMMVSSPIAKGTIEEYDLEAAHQIDGVVEIFTPNTLPKLVCRPEVPDWQIMWGQTYVPMENREIVYGGQPIAYVVAETLEAAEAAAERARFKFKIEQPSMPTLDSTSPAKEPETIWLGYIAGNLPSRLKRGEGKEAIKNAEVHLRGSWTLSFNHHNPMEVSATIAIWDAPDRLRVYETSQGGADFRNAYAKLFGLFREQVEVISSYIGGGFGCKGPVWPHSWLTVSAAKAVGRPVKLIMSRAQMYSSVGYREEQRIDVSLGA